MTQHNLIVHADQRQFAIQDKQADTEWRHTPPSAPARANLGWTNEAVTHHRIAAEPHRISIATARSDLVEVTITTHETAPQPNRAAEHIVEADLDTPNGELTTAGPADYPTQEHHLKTEQGRHRIRVSYVDAEPPKAEWNDFEYGAHYRYEIDLWPTQAPEDVKVLKQGTEIWDG